jgi:DNA-binding NarL/FixJ family response regulator
LLEPEYEVRAAPVDISQALAAADAFQPDAVIIDLDAGDVCLEIAKSLGKCSPRLSVTFLTSECDRTSESDPARQFRVITKTQSASEFLRALRASLMRLEPKSKTRLANMSDRERQVLTLLVSGMTMKETARALRIAPRTVAFHKYKCMATNRLQSNADLMAVALRHGLLPSKGK